MKLVRYLAFAALVGSSADAAVVNFDTVGGTFSDLAAINGNAAGSGTSAIDWGVAAYGGSNSGFSFAGNSTGFDSGSTVVGTFTHRNSTIQSNSPILQSASLTLNVAGDLMGQSFDFNWDLSLLHNETANEAATCPFGIQPCGDIVSFGELAQKSFEVTSGATIYTLLIEGLFDAPNGIRITELQTPEVMSKYAYLLASLSTRPAPGTTSGGPEVPSVPLPAGAPLLLAGLGAMVFVRRRRAWLLHPA